MSRTGALNDAEIQSEMNKMVRSLSQAYIPQRKLNARSPSSRRKLERRPERSKSRPMRSLLLRRYVYVRFQLAIGDVETHSNRILMTENVANSYRPRSSGRKVLLSTLNTRRRGSRRRSDGRCKSPSIESAVAAGIVPRPPN